VVARLSELRRLREQRFMSQADVAKTAGVSRSTIVKAEQGREIRRFVTIRKLAAALGVAPAELVAQEERP
jgi:transcriptional regulator with XRE-family HTH domain